VNVAPVIEPVAAVVCAADVSNVKTVMVDGTILKADGKLVANLSAPCQLVEASRDFLVGSVAAQEGWVVRAKA
jgi:cytosine/adenosine deaminase-related metal-dependent hydrolase